MDGTGCVAVTARLIRAAATGIGLTLALGVVAVSSFAAHYGTGAGTAVENAGSDTVLAAAVARQEAAGLVCGTKPGVTEVVLFQPTGSSSVTVLRFDAAVKAVSARQGAIRRYCA